MVPIYKYSAETARYENELTDYRESKRCNIKCKEAIEEAIRTHFDGMHLDTSCVQDIFDEFGYDRTMWVLAATVKNKSFDGRFSSINKGWARTIIPSHLDKYEFDEYAVQSHPAVLNGFIDSVRAEYEALELLSSEECLKDSYKEDYTNKLLILRPEILNDQSRKPAFQYFYAENGFGCDPNSIGRKVFGTFIADGEKSHFSRGDFIGVADKEKLPEWASKRLEAISAPKMKVRIYQINSEKDAIDTTTSAVTVTSEVTRKNSSQSVTEKTAESVTTAAANIDIQPKKESKRSQNSQDNGTPEVKKSESKTTTKAQTSPPKVTSTPAVKENKTTTTVRTSPPVVTTKAPQTTMPAKSITTAPPITTAEIYTEPAKMNITEHWLTYFSDSHKKDYYINVGRSLSNDGSDSSKVQAVFDYVTANFSNDDSCTYLSAVTMCLCEGIGLDCKYALISDWYAHCANAVNVDGVWYVLDTQAGGFLCGNFGFTNILDEYENELSVTLSDNDYE